MSRRTTLIVLAWNRWDLTRRCLDSLLSTDLSDSEILVVDNGSTDETPSALRRYPAVRVISNPTNQGYVRGNNAGIRAADSDSDLVLLNNDLEFRQSDWLQRLSACADSSPDIGLVGCRLALPDGRLLHAGTYIRPDTMWGQQIGGVEKDIGQFTADREVEGVVFACVYLKREVLNAIGPLSEDFESYFEDTDFCLRTRKAGFRVFLCGGVTLVHDQHGSTQPDPSHLSRIFQASRKVFDEKWRPELESRYSRDVLWQSRMNVPAADAMSCRQILKSLDAEGVRIFYRYAYGPGTPFPATETEPAGDYLMDLIRAREPDGTPGIGVVYGRADAFGGNPARTRVGYTMLPVDRFPEDWVRQAGEMDEVWVPSEFHRIGFLESGLRQPIATIPLGVDPNYFHPGIRGFRNPRGEFVFLASFDWSERHDPEGLLRAFSGTFRRKERVRLVCRIINRNPGIRVNDEVRRLGLDPRGGRISFMINQDFPSYQLGSLYHSADCCVSACRGTSWDLSLMEAMACGVPCIGTNWGPHREYLHEGNGYPLAVRGTIPAGFECPEYRGSSWADPDTDHLRFLLRRIYENREEATGRGRRAAEEIASRWTWGHTARRILDRLEALEA